MSGARAVIKSSTMVQDELEEAIKVSTMALHSTNSEQEAAAQIKQTFEQRTQGVGTAVEGGLGQRLIRRRNFNKGLTGVQTAEALHPTRRKPEPSLKPNTPNR